MTLELDFPDREVPARDGFPATPRRLRRWLGALDSTDRRALVPRCREGARALNRYRLKPRQRLEMMELLRPYARTALDYLGGRIHGQSLPLPEPGRRLFDVNQALLGELALGYELVLAGEAPRGRRKRAARAAQRALALHGERMMRAAQTYSAPGEADWHRVNAVYALAEDARVDRRAVDDDQLRAAARGRQSPQAAFKRIVLFALAGPEGLPRADIERVHRSLETWVTEARLAAEGRWGTERARFAVDLERPTAPCRRERVEAGPGSRLRVLDADDLVERLERLRAERAPTDAPLVGEDELSPAALGHLVDAWRPAVHERDERVQRGEMVDAEIALDAIHARIAAELGPTEDERAGDEAADPVAPTPVLSLQTIEGPGRLPERPGAGRRGTGAGRRGPSGERAARGAQARADRVGSGSGHPRWLLQDISATGFRLLREGEDTSRAAVGELAALRLAAEGSGGQRWSVGVIRRMCFVGEGRFEIGVQVLARNAVVARVRREPANPHRKRDRAREPTGRGLVLPGRRSEGIPPTLVVPAHMYRGGEVLELELRDRRERARLGAIREHTAAFSQYELGPAPARGRGSTSV